MFIHLETAQVYVLPDNYLVEDASLADIQYQLRLTFSPQQIAQFDAPEPCKSRDLHAQPYLPGFLGLNNIGRHDAMNVVIQALAHVPPLRNYFLQSGNGDASASASDTLPQSTELVRRFAILIRRLWNPRAFKSQVSPHEFLQEVTEASQGRFRLTEPCDPVEFLGWLLNRLHMDLVGSGSKARKQPSIITECFRGALRLESQKVIVRTGLEDDDDLVVDKLDHDGRRAGGQQDEFGHAKFNIDKAIKVDQVPFLLLAIDLPPLPVFQDVVADNIIPQVPIAHLLAKYDGTTIQESHGLIRRHKITRLPPYLIIHFRRFTHNRFVDERNTTIVNFPPVGLQLQDYVDAPELNESPRLGSVYNLLANITHEATAGTVRDQSVWRAQVHTRAQREQWFQMQDLIVEPVNRQMLFLGESYVQIWERVHAAEDMADSFTSLPAPQPPKRERHPTA